MASFYGSGCYRTRMHERLSLDQARRLTLRGLGFSDTRTLPTRRPFSAALDRIHVLQIDSVNVFSRSHYLPVFSRHGEYDRDRLDAQLWTSGEFTEYWAHEAAFLPTADRPLFGWRMADRRDRDRASGWTDEHRDALQGVRDRLRDQGPSLISELETEPRANRGPWWDWSDTKLAVERLFAWGEVVSVGREGFQRRYALTDQVLPDQVGATEGDRAASFRALIGRAARAYGVATAADLADYHRLKTRDAVPAIRELTEAGVLVPVTVAGWTAANGKPLPAWRHRDTVLPRRLAPDALVTPFDPLVWFRPRAERLFNFHYRIEIYTPQEKRQFGYYCLPLLVDGQLAGRIDLKADRAGGALLVQAAWREPDAPERTSEAAAQLLREAASWQELDDVRVSGIGNLPLPGL